MKAAVIERYGEPPVVRDVDEPRIDDGQLIEVTGAPLNPVDLSMASGRFYATPPPTPYVPGGEGIGRPVGSGGAQLRVYFRAALPHGALAERSATRGQTVLLPDSVDDGVAAALGTPGIAAYFALTQRARLQPGETVLVLGASGVLGTVAVQVARLLGASRVIAAARDEQRLERVRQLGADATVRVEPVEGLTERIREASGGRLEVIVDPLWGAPGAAAMEALSPHGRFIQIGQSAGPEAVVKSATVRGRYLSILGHTSFQVPWEEQAAAYSALLDYAAAGKLIVEYETFPLDAAPEAWKLQASSPHRKLLVSPQASS